jgi:hypothetical protein
MNFSPFLVPILGNAFWDNSVRVPPAYSIDGGQLMQFLSNSSKPVLAAASSLGDRRVLLLLALYDFIKL